VLGIIQFYVFSAVKMLCIRVSEMLLLQEIRGNGLLL
jgi:hypothetical protein